MIKTICVTILVMSFLCGLAYMLYDIVQYVGGS